MQKNSNSSSEAAHAATASKIKISKEQIKNIFKENFDNESFVMFSPTHVSTSFFCPIKEVTETEIIIKNPIPPELAIMVMNSTEFSLFCGPYRIGTKNLIARGRDLVFPLPEEAELSRERANQRFYYSDKDDVHVLISHPYDKSTIIKRKVFDVSEGGLSFRAREMSSFIQPGRILPEITLFMKGQKKLCRKGKVVYVTKIIDQSGNIFHQVGVKFTEA